MPCKMQLVTKTSTSLIYHQHFPPNFILPLQQHDNKKTLHLSKGKGYVYIEGVLTKVEKGMTFAIEKGKVHGILTTNECLECYSVVEGEDQEEIRNMFWEMMKQP